MYQPKRPEQPSLPMSKRSRILSFGFAYGARLTIERPQEPSTAPPSVPEKAGSSCYWVGVALGPVKRVVLYGL